MHVTPLTLSVYVRCAQLVSAGMELISAYRIAEAEMHRAAGVRARERSAPQAAVVVPAPEVVCRDAADDEIPRGARGVMRAAVEQGWTVRVTYARGPALHAKSGEVLRIVDSVALRMRREGHDGLPGQLIERAVAVWHDGRAEDSWWWIEGYSLPYKMGITALKVRMGIPIKAVNDGS